MRTPTAALALAAALAAAAPAVAAPKLWPPAKGPGDLMVHYGEEHLDDEDGEIIFPTVVADSIRWNPRLVVTSADKTSNGTEENLLAWKQVMSAYDTAGIPYFAVTGNHDRQALPGFPNGVSPLSPLGSYLTVFADRHYPFGDAPPPQIPGFAPAQRPADDPAGASSHYSFDVGNVRWIVVDNSCFEFAQCDRSQNPPFTNGETTFGYIARQATEAAEQGKLVFVALHMPTQDPRPEHTQPTPLPHTFGEGSSPENGQFEDAAKAAGVDGVFAGHIKGQWTYEAQGVPYYIDGGAGGEVYVDPEKEEVGVDYGYWHGWRLLRAIGTRVVTDAVPVFVPGGITVTEPNRTLAGDEVQFEAFGRQPTVEGPLVDKLELRDPDPGRPNAANLPEPARIWTTGNRFVAKPVASESDDPRRNRKLQTADGLFKAICPGTSKITITAGVESASRTLTVSSRPGPIVRGITRKGDQVRVGLLQPARVQVRSGGRVLRRTCSKAGTVVTAAKGRAKVTVLSDRRPVWRTV